MASVRVRCAADNHCQLRGIGSGGALTSWRQDDTCSEAGKNGSIFFGHLLRRSITEDPRLRVCYAQTLLPQEHMEHNGFFRRSYGVSRRPQCKVEGESFPFLCGGRGIFHSILQRKPFGLLSSLQHGFIVLLLLFCYSSAT